MKGFSALPGRETPAGGNPGAGRAETSTLPLIIPGDLEIITTRLNGKKNIDKNIKT
jgi:hypothetical protein